MSRLSRGLAGLALMLSGCTTASYDKADYHKVHPKAAVAMVNTNNTINVASAKFEKPTREVNYGEALRIEKTYGNLPKQRLNMYFVDGTNVEKVVVDSSGPLDREAVFGLCELRKYIPDNVQRSRLDIGVADTDFNFSAASGDQLSNRCGLETVDVYANTNRDCNVAVRRVTGLKGSSEHVKYGVSVGFGDGFKVKQKTVDNLFVLNTVEDGALVSVLAGFPIGAAWAGVDVAGRASGWAEGRQLNSDAFLSDSVSFAGKLSGKDAYIASILEQAKKVRASDIAVVKYDGLVYEGTNVVGRNKGTGVVYVNGAENVRGLRNGFYFETNEDGVNHLFVLGGKILKAATVIGVEKGCERTVNHYNMRCGKKSCGGGITGGQTGGPGGNGPGVSGGQGGSSGGNGGY